MKTIHIIIIFFLFAFTLSVGIFFGSYLQSDDGKVSEFKVSELEHIISNLRKNISDKEAEIADLKRQLAAVTSKGAGAEPEKETGSGSTDAVTAADAEIAQLLSGDPKFADVLTLYSRLSADRTVWDNLTNKRKLSAYYRVCNTLLNGDLASIKAIMDPGNPIYNGLSKYNGLSNQHKWAVLSIGYGLKDGTRWASADFNSQLGADGGIRYYINSRTTKYPTFSKVFNAFKSGRNRVKYEL